MDSRGGTGHSRRDVVGFGTDGELFEEAVAGVLRVGGVVWAL